MMSTSRPPLALFTCALVVLAGCPGTFTGLSAGSGTTSSSPPVSPTPITSTDLTYGTMDYDFNGYNHQPFEGGVTYPPYQQTPSQYTVEEQYYVAIIDSESMASRFNHTVLKNEPSMFVNETDFEESTLVIYQAYPSNTAQDYHVESIRRANGRLVITVDTNELGGGDASGSAEILFVRIHNQIPDVVTIRDLRRGQTTNSTDGLITVTESNPEN